MVALPWVTHETGREIKEAYPQDHVRRNSKVNFISPIRIPDCFARC